ncbi:MAG: hypothetical protein M3421_15440 [Bacteroidota bacterium]|nr:hypothetical protein [Bacteroidota bacterium]
MKIFDITLISLAIGFIIIGIHQSIVFGFGNSYWIFMLTLVFLLWFKIRNSGKVDEATAPLSSKHKKMNKSKVKNK